MPATWRIVHPEKVEVQIDWPGYHLHGEVLQAQRAVLTVGRSVKYDIPVFLVYDPDTGEKFGIPIQHCVVMKDPPIIDLKGRLHGGICLANARRLLDRPQST